MRNNDGKLTSGQLEGFRASKLIPLVVRYAAGTPSIVQNPTNEAITLTDVGTGSLRLTLANPGVAPLIVPGIVSLPAAAGTLVLQPSLLSAPTSAIVNIQVNSGADGATATDPVDVHILIVKQEQA